jgi:transcriptional regulator with XRE-family HTH domain
MSSINGQESLDKYVRRVLKNKRLSLMEVSRRARGGISDAYLCSITKGNFGSLTVAKLKALAEGLGVPEQEVLAVACGSEPGSEPDFESSKFDSLFNKYRGLSDEDKRELGPILEMFEREVEWRQKKIPEAPMHAD